MARKRHRVRAPLGSGLGKRRFGRAAHRVMWRRAVEQEFRAAVKEFLRFVLPLTPNKGYTAKVEFGCDRRYPFYGRVVGCEPDVVNFYARHASELQREFELSVDVYLGVLQHA